MSSELTITQDQTDWTSQQVAALKTLGVSNDVTQADLAIFLTQSKRTGLDPFSRQIYMIGRKQKTPNGYETKQTIQVGIDGLRAIAHRVAQQCHEVFSMSDTLWADNSGVWHDVWLSPEPPAAAKVSVKRGGGVFSAVAIFKEYAPIYNGKLSGMWATKPALMIAKCAEALALRKAFPSDMSGIYTDDEMEKAEDISTPTVVETSTQQQAETTSNRPRVSTQKQREQILAMLAEAGIRDRLAAIDYLKHSVVDNPSTTLTEEEAEAIIANRATIIKDARAWVREQNTKPAQETNIPEGEQE